MRFRLEPKVRMKQRLIALGAIAVLVFAVTVLLKYWAAYQVGVAQIAASDWVMVKAEGPRLGARPVRDDIVLVLFDVKTAGELGDIRSYQQDVVLYRKLFEAGARCVYDTRTIAAADEAAFEEYRALFDEMLDIRSDGSLMRDIYLGVSVLQNTNPQYATLQAVDLVKAFPHAIPLVRSRLCPMFHVTSEGLRESAPLLIARQAWGLDKVDPDLLSERLRESGVVTAWHQQAPQAVDESDIPASPYPMGDRQIAWYPFLTSTMLVPPAAFWISYDPAVEDYRRHSYLDVLQGAELPDFKDRIVIIGYAAETEISPENFEVPSMQRKAASAEVIAVAVQSLLDERIVREPSEAMKYVLIGVMCVALALTGGLLRPVQAVALSLGVLLIYFLGAVLAYRLGWYSDFAVAPGAAVVSGFLGIVYSSWQSVRARQRIVDLFGRYVPRAVVQQLMLQPQLKLLQLGGTKQEVTVMFADIRGFTTFSEELPPEEVVRQLNSLLEIMVECTFENEGTLDKFIGDAILVLFNAPLKQADHAARAVRTALAIQRRLARHPTGLAVGIGLHRGEAVVGNIGTPRRLEYTAIGSTVNIASRLCGVAEPGEVILSAAMIEELGDEFKVDALPPVTVKGVKAPLEVYRLQCAEAIEVTQGNSDKRDA